MHHIIYTEFPTGELCRVVCYYKVHWNMGSRS